MDEGNAYPNEGLLTFWTLVPITLRNRGLRVSSQGRSGVEARKGMRACIFPCGSPSTELSDFRQSARSGN